MVWTMRRIGMAFVALVLMISGAVPASAAAGRRVVVYYQTIYNGSTYVSPLPLRDAGATDVVVGAIHLATNSVVHLNDDPQNASKFTRMWQDLATLRSQGVHVLAFVGGAAAGSFQRLETQFDTYYPLLRNLIRTYSLSGIDLDVEEHMSNGALNKLIDALRADFGSSFLVTLAPVATELSGGGGLSGLNYDTLYRDRGSQISWFNTQFYCGWGSLSSTSGYDNIVRRGVVPASKVVAGPSPTPRTAVDTWTCRPSSRPCGASRASTPTSAGSTAGSTSTPCPAGRRRRSSGR